MRDTTSNSSFEVYYRSDGSVGIPFGWESTPGTPKLKSRESPLPPLTPPPSFRSSPVSTKPAKKHHKNNIVSSLLNLKKTPLMYRSPSSSRSSSSTPSSPLSARSTPYSSPHGSKQHGIVLSPRISFDSRFESRIEEDDDLESPVSILCFRARNRRSQGCSSSIIKLFL
ncbi:hypothetical protein BUALT_BualtUnG0053800 [Buddleja alternifolia]|uniref:Uncharacterized protein n=1 Tax=Buddleja alternifolia TaxID=168488 RepID=A0AAV6W4N8_9LAMI|nr:hypothetical protein BUALT_BualtUnG0053800 [Buddleja alternifolia]